MMSARMRALIWAGEKPGRVCIFCVSLSVSIWRARYYLVGFDWMAVECVIHTGLAAAMRTSADWARASRRLLWQARHSLRGMPVVRLAITRAPQAAHWNR